MRVVGADVASESGREGRRKKNKIFNDLITYLLYIVYINVKRNNNDVLCIYFKQ